MTWKPKKNTMLIGDKAELVKNEITDIPIEFLLDSYKELKSSYKVAKKFDISATAVKRVLKKLGVLRTQSSAAKDRGTEHLQYERTDAHKQNLSELAKKKIGEKNPFFGKTHTEENKRKFSENAKANTSERNPNYKTGSYVRRPRDFKQAEFTRLRNFVFNRDDYTCLYCKCMGGNLHAHHKIPFWIEKEAYLDPDNLVTVCTKCHFQNAHLNNWAFFDVTIIDDRLLKRYKLDRERLNELAVKK